MMQVDDQVKMRLISQLNKYISRVFQNYLIILMVPVISTFFLLPSLGVFPVIFILDLNDSESAKLAFDSSL